MRLPALAIITVMSLLLVSSCQKLQENSSFSTLLLDRFSSDSKINPFSLTPFEGYTSQTANNGPYLSYTFSDGLTFIEALQLESLNEEGDDLFNNYLSNLLTDPQGDHWVLTYSTLEFYDAESDHWRSYNLPENRRGIPVAVSILRNGDIICVNQSFMLLFSNGAFSDFNLAESDPFDEISGGFLASDGNLWLNGPFGLMVIDDQGDYQINRYVNAVTGRAYETFSVLGSGRVTEDYAGSIWTYLPFGFLEYTGEQWKFHGSEQNVHLDGTVKTITSDANGHIWAVSGTRLIHVFPDGYWDSVELEGLTPEEYEQIAGLDVNLSGDVWLIGAFGIIHLVVELPI
jgi:streptogramin lyase